MTSSGESYVNVAFTRSMYLSVDFSDTVEQVFQIFDIIFFALILFTDTVEKTHLLAPPPETKRL